LEAKQEEFWEVVSKEDNEYKKYLIQAWTSRGELVYERFTKKPI
jgi:hypothetical protein